MPAVLQFYAIVLLLTIWYCSATQIPASIERDGLTPDRNIIVFLFFSGMGIVFIMKGVRTPYPNFKNKKF